MDFAQFAKRRFPGLQRASGRAIFQEAFRARGTAAGRHGHGALTEVGSPAWGAYGGLAAQATHFIATRQINRLPLRPFQGRDGAQTSEPRPPR
jgi:hypothetical protein